MTKQSVSLIIQAPEKFLQKNEPVLNVLLKLGGATSPKDDAVPWP